MPHSELFGDVWMSVLKILWNLSAGFFSFFFLNLSLQTTCCCVLISWTATCFKGLLELSRDGDRRQRLTPWKDALQLPDWRDRGVEQIQRDSQSESVDFPDCLSHYRLLTTSPWLSLAVSFSHIFQRQPWKKKKKGVGQYRQHCPLKSVPVPFHSPPLASERHFLSFPVLSAHVKQLLTLFPPTVRWFQSAGVQKLLLNTQYDTSVHLFSMQHYAAAALCKLPH